MADVIKYERNFSNLLEDSLAFLIDADINESKENYVSASRLARASIFSTLFMYECASNCCLSTLELSETLYGKIERMDTLSKFEFYLMLSGAKKKLDRSVVEIEKINELKKLRDNLAHPKINKIQYAFSKHEENITTYEPVLKKTNKLGLPTYMSCWYISEAIIAANALNDFLNYFFLELCDLNVSSIARLLYSDEDPKIQQRSFFSVYTTNDFKVAHSKWGIELKYLGIKY